MTVTLSDSKQRHLSQIHAGLWLTKSSCKEEEGGKKKIYSLSVYSQGQQAHPLSPPEQTLKETSLPANLMHKHSKADKENV